MVKQYIVFNPETGLIDENTYSAWRMVPLGYYIYDPGDPIAKFGFRQAHRKNKCGWKRIKQDELPPIFRTYLLMIGAFDG